MATERESELERGLREIAGYAQQQASFLAGEGLLGDARSWRYVADAAHRALDADGGDAVEQDLLAVLNAVQRRLRYHHDPSQLAAWIDQQLSSP